MRARVAVLACGLMLSACRSPVPTEPSAQREPGEVVARWSQLVGARSSLRAHARLSVDGEAGRGGDPLRIRSRQRLSLARPANLRVAMLGPLHTALAVLVTDGSRYQLRAGDGSRETGAVYGALLWQLTGLDLDPAEAVDLLLGMPALPEARGPQRGAALPGGGLRVELRDARGASAGQLDFDARGRLQAFEAGGASPGLVVRFGEYAPVGGSPFAHRIEVDSRGARAQLELWDVELNPELAEDTFHVETAGAPEPSQGRGG